MQYKMSAKDHNYSMQYIGSQNTGSLKTEFYDGTDLMGSIASVRGEGFNWHSEFSLPPGLESKLPDFRMHLTWQNRCTPGEVVSKIDKDNNSILVPGQHESAVQLYIGLLTDNQKQV